MTKIKIAQVTQDAAFATAVNAVVGGTGNILNVLTYGALADARSVSDFVTTASSTTVTSATIAFVVGDVGKSICVEGAGVGGLPLVTTISSRTNATTVVVANAATGSTSGKRGTVGTDNATAFQAAIDAVDAASGGSILIPSGQYLICGSFQTPLEGARCLLLLPARDIVTAKPLTIDFHGEVPPTPNLNWPNIEFPPLATDGTILICYKSGTTGDEAIFGGGHNNTWHVSSIRAVFRNLTFRTYNNPKITPLNLLHIGQTRLEHLEIDHGTILANTAQPTNGAWGIRLPQVNNWADVLARDINIIGHGVGINWAEHANLDHIQCWLCLVAFQPEGTYHASRAGRIMAVGCTKIIQFATGNGVPHRLTIQQLDVESPTFFGDWRDTTTMVDDLDNIGRGVIWFANVVSFAGESSTFQHVNGNNLVVYDLTTPASPISMAGSSAVAAPTFSPVAGTYSGTQSVVISSATSGAVIRYTTNGSTPTRYTGTVYSGAVSVPASATIKAIAYKDFLPESAVTSAAYVIT